MVIMIYVSLASLAGSFSSNLDFIQSPVSASCSRWMARESSRSYGKILQVPLLPCAASFLDANGAVAWTLSSWGSLEPTSFVMYSLLLGTKLLLSFIYMFIERFPSESHSTKNHGYLASTSRKMRETVIRAWAYFCVWVVQNWCKFSWPMIGLCKRKS